jgi:hypothetical protein
MLIATNVYNTFIIATDKRRERPIEENHSCKTSVVYIHIRAHMTLFPSVVNTVTRSIITITLTTITTTGTTFSSHHSSTT